MLQIWWNGFFDWQILHLQSLRYPPGVSSLHVTNVLHGAKADKEYTWIPTIYTCQWIN